jgi:hypothetical protein
MIYNYFVFESEAIMKLFHGEDKELDLLKLHMTVSECVTRHGVHKPVCLFLDQDQELVVC